MGRIAGALVAVDLILLVVAWMQGGHWVVNSQIAYVTSALVMAGSMFSYARMVRGRLESGAVPEMDDRDMIDKMEDPYGVYDVADASTASTSSATDSSAVPAVAEPVEASNPSITEPAETVTEPAEVREAIKAEKERIKAQRRTPKEALRDSRAAMSLYRLGAYGALLFGFFYLRGNGLLEIMPYLIGLGLPIVVIVGVLMVRAQGETA